MYRSVFSLLLIFLSVSPALAHVGHLGELAGHAHWLGLGAAVAAAAIAAAIAKQKSEKPKSEETEETDGVEEGEAA